jgi:hypothetical protein
MIASGSWWYESRTGNAPSGCWRTRLCHEVRAETLATFREAVAKLRKDCPVKMDDDSALLLMARHLLAGPADSGRASYQIAMKVCPHCEAGAQQACGEMIPVAPE